MSKTFAKEIGARNITVNCISPGPTETGFFLKGKTEQVLTMIKGFSPMNKLGLPDDIAKVAKFLISDEA